MPKIKEIKILKYSSEYGNKKVFGQPLNVRSGVIIKIYLSKNIYGIGESYQSAYLPEIAENFYIFIRDILINKNSEDISIILKQLNIPFVTNSGYLKSLISAIEIALYDANSKFYKIPLYKYLKNKSKNRAIDLYASGGSAIFTPSEIQEDVRKVKMAKFNNYKMRIGYYPWKIDQKRIKIAYSSFKNKSLAIDAIMGTFNKWNLLDFKKKILFFNSLNLKWIEEPLHPNKLIDYTEIKKISKNPIAIGESFTTESEFSNALKYNCGDIFQPDVTQLGFEASMKILKNIHNHKKKTVFHIWGSNISFLANLNLAIAEHKIKLIEFPVVKLKLLQEDLNKIIQIKNGKVILNDKIKGLGINLDKIKLKRFKFIKKSGFKI